MSDKMSAVEILKKQLADAVQAEKEEKKNEGLLKRKELEKEAKKMKLDDLRKYYVENELKKRSRPTPKAKAKKEKVACACATWWCNAEKDPMANGSEKGSKYNDVKQCSGNGIHEVEGRKVCERHKNEMTIKGGKPHHGFYNEPWEFPEEMLGSKQKKKWVASAWKRYPAYAPENVEELLKSMGLVEEAK